MAVGTGTAAPLDSDVALQQEVYRAQMTRKVFSTSKAIFKLFIPSTDANGNKTSGLAWARSGAGPYTITVTHAAHGFVTGDAIAIEDATPGGSILNGERIVAVVNANSYTFSVSSDPGASGTLSSTKRFLLSEVGIFVLSTFSQGVPLGGGTLFARAVTTPIVKDSSIQVTFTAEYPLISSG